jgi:lipid-A-disaccharide synthase
MARNTPAAVIYRVGRILYLTGKALVRVPSITLPNLIAGRTVFPEFASVGNPEPAVAFLTDSIQRMLVDHDYRQELHETLGHLRLQYARPGASRRAAECLGESLGLTRTNGRPATHDRRSVAA